MRARPTIDATEVPLLEIQLLLWTPPLLTAALLARLTILAAGSPRDRRVVA